MEEATSTYQQSYGLGPRGPNPPYGVQQTQGPHQPAPGPSGAPRPEEQHHKPFFYIQPSQPYMPMQSMQWPVPVPMPVSYNPYYGYPGLGYGMPVMPHFQPNPYMEPPAFIVPHTNLHLMDYRRMLNPQYYQTMAYHSRRFHYQHNGHTREMTSSEVQTEPLSAVQRTGTTGFSNVEASSGLPVRSSDGSQSVSVKQPLPPAVALQKGDYSLELKDMAPSSATRTPPNSSFVIQTEEVRIECCTTPVGLQLLHSHDTAEVSHNFSQDMGQCSSSLLQGCVLQDEGLCLPADQSEQALQVCPDILLVGTPNSGEMIPALEDSRSQTDPVTVSSDFGSQVAAHGDVQETSSDNDQSTTSNNFHFKVVHLPFNPKYLDELWKMKSTVWSTEETVIPSPDSLIQNGDTDSHDETLSGEAEVPSVDVLMVKEAPTEELVPVFEMPLLAEEDMVPTAEDPGDEMCPMIDVHIAEEYPITKLNHTAKPALVPNLLLSNSPLKADGNKYRRETNAQDHQDTSFESLPAYLPSTSWLADFDNVDHCSIIPPTPKKQNRCLSSRGLDVPTRRRKLDLHYKEQATVRKPRERYKPKGKVDRRSLSDHECCLNSNFNDNAFTSHAPKRERLCSRCVSKSRICTSDSPALDGHTFKRKAAFFQQWNDVLLPTCEACKPKANNRLMTKGSGLDVCGPRHGHDTEGESSENCSCLFGSKWRSADRPRKLNDLKRPLASKQNVEKCPAAMNPKLREKNCVCNEPQLQSVAWERLRHCPHGNAIHEMDENCAVPVSLQDKWTVMDQIYLTHRLQNEKSWKAVTPYPDSDYCRNDARSPHFNKHKKSQPQSQGTCRKDTRC
ncbi:uncharacterized protein LOC115025241 [Cottoperca gobio]|uniref:Uncharacterized protein LOC115025241 n=1 Tax=Cottoperca gobio TaxID=56716 RepID=A0A6J2RUZ0_COTGO|nr:uncharacterized protein LOC115025241 [Cottoperca gobio]